LLDVMPLGRTTNTIPRDRVSVHAPSPLLESRERSGMPHDKRLRGIINMLTNGETFKKFKHKKAKSRAVWCTYLLDFILWGDSDHATVKGYIKSSELQEVNQGYGKVKCRIFLVTATRTLELEAKSTENAKEWVMAFEFLIQTQKQERDKKLEMLKVDGFAKELQSFRADHQPLLTDGEVFKKWPGRKMIQKGSFTIRRIWCDNKLDKLCWGDIDSSKVKGFIQMEDILQIIEDSTDSEGLKFTLLAVDRSLDLEAKSTFTRQRWVRAFRYMINERKLQHL